MITYSPSVSVSAIVRKLKQETTYTIWKDFPNLHKVYWKEKTFCANSFQRLKTFGFSWHYYIKKEERIIRSSSLFYASKAKNNSMSVLGYTLFRLSINFAQS